MPHNSDLSETSDLSHALPDARPLSEIAHEQRQAWQRLEGAEPKRIAMPTQERPKRLLMKTSTPTVSTMVDDAYQALAMQLHQYREGAHREIWESPKAGAFGKLVTSLVALQETERKNTASYALGELSDPELEALGREAKDFLAQKSAAR